MSKNSPTSMKDYEARDDAHHLMRAHEVVQDPKRHKKALKELDNLQREKSKEAMSAKAAKGLKKAFGC